MAKIVCFGELLIDFVALERDTSVGEANRFEKAAGGAPANVAVGLAKLGIESAFVTQLGNDPFGVFLKQTLAEQNVDVSMVRFTDKANTALAFVAVEASGERSFAFYRNPSADMLLEPDDLDVMGLQQAAILHYGSITLIDEPVKSATLKAVDIARKGGAIISYDPNLREVLWPSLEAAKQGILEGLQHTNIVKMNNDELKFLTDIPDLISPDDIAAAARQLWHDDLRLMVITRGPAGCIAITANSMMQASGFSVTVEDTIGAGDGFMAGLLAGVASLDSVEHLSDEVVMLPILKRANAVGALTASQRGAIPALPDAGTVQSFMEKH